MTAPKQPQDHKPPAAELEVSEDGTVALEFEGMAFDLPASPETLSFKALLASEKGQYAIALEEMLPADQFQQLLDTNPSAQKITDLMRAIAERYGFDDLGE